MRGLELNPNLIKAGATFSREALTAPCYRLFSINDRHPAMLRVGVGGVAIDLEIWRVPRAGIAAILLQEPDGLCIGKVWLADNTRVLGVIGEDALVENMPDISIHRGWREYLKRAGAVNCK